MVSSDSSLASHGVTAAFRLSVPGIDHQVASPFWEFLNSTGPVRINGQTVNERLFDPWFYATGFPITEAYWANVKVAGTVRLVLLQCFERRCLTFTPGNPAGFETEAGNVGQHYRVWRYERIPDMPGEGYEWALVGCAQEMHDHFAYHTEDMFRSYYVRISFVPDLGLVGHCPRCDSMRIYVPDGDHDTHELLMGVR